MIQRCHRARLALEALTETLTGDFDRHITIQARVMGSINIAHSNGAKRLQNVVGPEFVAC